MKHRHSGGLVRYRTRRGRVMARKRPMHPIINKAKREGRRGSRRFLGFGRGDEAKIRRRKELLLMGSDTLSPEQAERKAREEIGEENRDDGRIETTYKKIGFQNELIDEE